MNRHEFYDKLKEYNSLQHYGTLGQKWGVRKWQNYDGTFNEAGKERYFGKNGTTKKNTEDEVGSIYSTGQKIKNLFPQKRVNDNGEEYDARYQNHYGYLTEKGKKYLERHPHDATGKLNMKLYAESLRRGAENDAEREKERLAREAKQKSDIEYINNLKSNIKTTKELKGEEISDKEFKDIIQELDNFNMRDFERNHKEDYNKVADIGIDALNKAEGGWVEDDIRDDGNREWFMWEDQTIGNPEIAYLYYKGYSKDYIKQYLNKTVPTEDYGKYTDEEDSVYGYPYSKGFFVRDEFHRGGNDYIDALFDNQNEQKIGGLFNKTPEEKEFKEAKRLAQELNLNNGTRIIKELRNSEYGKKHLQPVYDEYEENMNKIIDKANKIINDSDYDEVETGIVSAFDKKGTNASIGDIINYVRKQHHSNSGDDFINTDSLPLIKSEEDLYTEALKIKKDFGNNVEKEFKTLYPKAKTENMYHVALTDYLNNKLEKVNEMSEDEYRKYQLYNTINYGLVPEINKKIIRKNILEPTKKIYPKVEKIINNTKAGDPGYNWTDINDALSKLGLNNVPANELTNADWKKVYEICSR